MRIDMSAQEILSDLQALEEELRRFENKHGMRSETMCAAYQNGEEPDEECWVLDFGEWASIYRTWLSRRSAYYT